MAFLKKKDFSFSKRTNAEVANYFERMLALLPVKLVPPVADETPTKYECMALGISNYLLEEAYDVRDQMNDCVKQQSRKIETSSMKEQDAMRDYYVSKLFNHLSVESKNPEGKVKEAAHALSAVADPYKKTQYLAYDEETAQIRGLLLDLRKEAYAGHIETLGLTELLSKLEEANEAFVALTADRFASQVVRKQQTPTQEVRKRLEEVYDNLTMLAQAKVVLEPSEEAEEFIHALNALIDETNAVYNRRVGVAAANKSKEEEEGDDKGEGEGGGEGWTPVK